MEYRVTKYNPEFRDSTGKYLVSDEWTSFFDIGKSVSIEDYECTEKAYIDTAIEVLQETNCIGLNVVSLEKNAPEKEAEEEDFLKLNALKNIFQSVLREEIWCKFENESHYVHFGYDYYMYIGTPDECINAREQAKLRGLYVEEFKSPYHDLSS